MIRELKIILHAIARLPSADQRWIIKNLPRAQLETFKRLNGVKHLQEAQHFRPINIPATLQATDAPSPLPFYCQSLIEKAPLYIATVLEQGEYAWKADFLSKYDQEGIIQACLENHVIQIKPLVKQALFKDWENSLTFDKYLDDTHG